MSEKKPGFFKRMFTNFSAPVAAYQNYQVISQNNAIQGYSGPESLSAIYTCIRILSESLSKLPCYLVDKSGEDKVYMKDEPLYKMMRFSPNSHTTMSSMLSVAETHRNMNGNSYLLINRQNGRPTSLEMVYPTPQYYSTNALNIIINRNFIYVVNAQLNNGELFYQLNKYGESVTVPADDLLHFRGISMDGFFGISQLMALQRNIIMQTNAFNTIENYYKNNPLTTNYLKSTINTQNRKTLDEAVKNINDVNGAVQNAGKFIILPPFTEMENKQMSFIDMEFINTIKFNTTQICSLYGVPGYMLGEGESLRFNNMEQMQISFIVNTLSTICHKYEEEFNAKLLTQKQRDAGWSFEFDLFNERTVDYSTRINGYQKLFSMGVITPNQIAKMEGLPTYENGDRHYIMTNLASPENTSGATNIDMMDNNSAPIN